jgi:hypothetical protein
MFLVNFFVFRLKKIFLFTKRKNKELFTSIWIIVVGGFMVIIKIRIISFFLYCKTAASVHQQKLLCKFLL